MGNRLVARQGCLLRCMLQTSAGITVQVGMGRCVIPDRAVSAESVRMDTVASEKLLFLL